MMLVRRRILSAFVATAALTAGVVGGGAGAALAAYNPSAPPYPSDPNDVASIAIYDATTGARVTSGDNATALNSYYFAASGNVTASGQTKAVLSGYLAEAGKVPGAWSGRSLGAATTFPVTTAPAPVNGFTFPVAKGGSTSTMGDLAAAYPNTATSTSDFYQLYQLRVTTTFPTPSDGQYAAADIQVDTTTGTWKVVNPLPPAATATSTTLSASPASPQVTGTAVTLSAAETPAAAGTVEFFDGTTSLGSATVSSGSASLAPITPPVGTHSYTATFTPADTASFAPSTSAVTSYVITAAPTSPAAPTGVTATPGDTTADVSWTAPNDGGSAITKYTVTYTPTGGMPTSVDVTGTSTTLTGLVDGTQYSVTVSATNSIGTGPDSSTVTVTPKAPTAPDAPTGLAATPGNGQLALTWAAPAANGSPITSYKVTSTPAGGMPTTVDTMTTTTSYTLPGLTNGTSYTVTVAAVNGVGTGPDSTSVTAAPGTVPGAPTGVSAVAGDGSATVSFTAPADNGGFAISGYTVTASTGQTATGTSSPIVVPGLANGTSRTFTVRATNARGAGPASAASNAVVFFTTSLSLRTSSTAVTAGQYFRVSGVLTGGPVGGVRITLGVYGDHQPTRYIALTTASNGTFTLLARGVYSTSFKAFFAGTSVQRAAASNVVRTAVRTSVVITSPRSGYRTTTRRLAIGGTTSPNKHGYVINLYERRGGKNVLISRVRVASNGTFRFVCTFSKGTHYLQVGIGATPTNAAGSSRLSVLYEV